MLANWRNSTGKTWPAKYSPAHAQMCTLMWYLLNLLHPALRCTHRHSIPNKTHPNVPYSKRQLVRLPPYSRVCIKGFCPLSFAFACIPSCQVSPPLLWNSSPPLDIHTLSRAFVLKNYTWQARCLAESNVCYFFVKADHLIRDQFD